MNQIGFDPFDYLDKCGGNRDQAIAMAKAAQLEYYARLRRDKTKDVTRFTLTNQLEKYNGFGVPGRGIRNVYYVQTRDLRPVVR